MSFLIVNVLYIILPFCFAALHHRLIKQRISVHHLNFLYFLFFNTFLKAVPVGLSAISLGQEMAIENNWGFSPMFAQYGVAIGTMGLLGVIAVLGDSSFRLAVTLLFAFYYFFSGVLHVVEVMQGVAFTSHNVFVLIAFNFITTIILLYFCFHRKT